MLVVSVAVVVLVGAEPEQFGLRYFVPFTFLGNSLAPLPYDGAVVYLGARHPPWLIVSVAVAATLVIEAWNMELLSRLLARDGTRAFRSHRITQWSLHWYRKAPFWSLVLTCVLPLVPHDPMRFLAVLAGYPLWKYQTSVILGRGTRYAGLVLVGATVPIPGAWLLAASLIILAFGIRGARKMNQGDAPGTLGSPAEARPEEA
jgi:membrane protein YqaA with SNARE-associated domain